MDDIDTPQEARGGAGLTEAPDAQQDAQTMLFVGLAEDQRRVVTDALSVAGKAWLFWDVPGYLHAIGHLTSDGRVDALVGVADAFGQSIQPTVRALRRAAPQLRLLLYASPEHQCRVDQFLDAGFNAVISSGATAKEVLRAVENGKADPTSAPLKPDNLESPGPTRRHAPEPRREEAAGDVDLIECLLAGKHCLQEAALPLVVRQSGIDDLQCVNDRAQVPAGHASVEIVYGQWRSGWLHAPPPVNASQLAPWGGWLARWLALEQHQGQLWRMAMRDDLTGVWNRRYFRRFLKSVLERAAEDRFNVTVMVFDIDDFKSYNDRFGHPAGDEILREAARLMVTAVREHDVVARIGGDEFAVIFWDAEGPRHPDSHHPQDVVAAARRFQRAICEQDFPKLAEARATLSVSGGLAGFPWDGKTAEELLEQADKMALQSKRQGKNAFTLGPGARRLFDGER